MWRNVVRVAILVLTVASWVLAGDASADPAGIESRPNVVWICLDAARASNFSFMGYERNTSPNLDRLAMEGTVFEQCFSQAGFTTLSVPSYMTGRYFPVDCFAVGKWNRLWKTPPPSEQYIASVMAQNGYATCMVTAHSWMTPADRMWKSFEHSIYPQPAEGQSHPPAEDVLRRALDWLSGHSAPPFFLYLHLMDTHWPHFLESPYDQWCDPDYPRALRAHEKHKSSDVYTHDDQVYMRGLHDGGILRADAKLGWFFQELKRLRLYDNTVFVVHSDHGEALGEDGVWAGHPAGLQSDEVFHVPLLIGGPGIPSGRRVKSLVQNADIVPTLAEFLALDSSMTTDGSSLVPLLAPSPAASVHDYTFARFAQWGVDDHGVVLRDSTYKYIICPEMDRLELWRVPDMLGKRSECRRDCPAEFATMARRLDEDVQPLWDAYRDLPAATPCAFEQYFDIPGRNNVLSIVPSEGWTRKRAPTDQAWHVRPRLVECCSWMEEPPPITIRFRVPNARYEVRLSLVVGDDEAPQPGSSVRFKAQSDVDFRLLTTPEGKRGPTYEDLGEYTVTDQCFAITIARGLATRWARLATLKLIPVSGSSEALSVEEDESRLQRLEALGYLE